MADSDPGEQIASLAERLAVTSLGLGALAHALSHRSWCSEHPDEPSNERLEFLGDAVLGLAVTEHLYLEFPDMAEGELAKARASVVSAVTLAEVARRLDVGVALRLGRGEESSGGREKSSILADAMEAIFGAVHLEQGPDVARALILRLLGDEIAAAAVGPGGEDFKTRLQELVAQRWATVPVYTISDEGPDHAKRFSASVTVDQRLVGAGGGRSKKQAEQAAARAALHRLDATTAQGAASAAREDGEVHA